MLSSIRSHNYLIITQCFFSTQLTHPETNVKVCATLGELLPRTWYRSKVGRVCCQWGQTGEHRPTQELNVYVRLVNEFTLQDLDDLPISKRNQDISALGLTRLHPQLSERLFKEETNLGHLAHAANIATDNTNSEDQATCCRVPPKQDPLTPQKAQQTTFARLARTKSCDRTTEERPRKRLCVTFSEETETKFISDL